MAGNKSSSTGTRKKKAGVIAKAGAPERGESLLKQNNLLKTQILLLAQVLARRPGQAPQKQRSKNLQEKLPPQPQQSQLSLI